MKNAAIQGLGKGQNQAEEIEFPYTCTKNIGPAVGGEIDAWLRTSGLSPRTRNNIRTSLCTLLKSAVWWRYLPKDHAELESVSVVSDRDGNIEVFTPAELTVVLCCASDRMMPFIVLGAFAGIRHAEIQRLE